MSNPHIDEAMALMQTMPRSGLERSEMLEMAQIEATLAVAYELRTANLLAALPHPAFQISAPRIAERLTN